MHYEILEAIAVFLGPLCGALYLLYCSQNSQNS